MIRRVALAWLVVPVGLAACVERAMTPSAETGAEAVHAAEAVVDGRMVAEGREIFRFDDFGDWRFWTDSARLHELVEGVSPNQALSLGLKVDADAVPPEVLLAVLADPALLDDPATTRALLSLNAVLGLTARIEGDRITRMGITCAFCHSTVDNSVTAGIGRRQDGWANGDLAVGTILSLLPGLPTIAAALGVPVDVLRTEFESWPPGFYDPRVNIDARFEDPPVVIPPVYGLRGVGLATFTGEGPVSYWNNYVAVTQMHGKGSFIDPKLGLRIVVPRQEDEVRGKLPALRLYQFSLEAPPPPPGSFDPEVAARGRVLFEGAARCTACHVGPLRTDQGRLHAPAETGMEPTWAQRGTTGKYRTTPLRGLWQHPPYFHDGSAATLRDVVEHYDGHFGLALTEQQKQELIEYLMSL